MNEVLVRSGGLYTTVQDAGRDGHYAIGMPPSGAMDRYSFTIANLLAGNPGSDAALEATYLGPELEFTDSRAVAVTGADSSVTINGASAPMWTSLRVGPGDVLGFGPLAAGARPYVAIGGGLDVPEYLNSRSTYKLTGIGGFEGRALAEGDRVPLGQAQDPPAEGTTVPAEFLPEFPDVVDVRLVVGLCSYRLTEDALNSFFDTTWKVTKDADRIGYRLRGGTIDFIEREQPFGAGSDPANVVDLGYPIGSVQIPGGNEPIILLNDAVTGGGYATVGTVVSADRDRIAQTGTGGHVRFTATDVDSAVQARQDRDAWLHKLRTVLSG
ncbi:MULTISPECIES: biotin-dependent carboxyltransferase family protein [unclassified Actinopolyspora]|uniref:5-oxoprolinase subunit C family protein n=1 Tax=unclassified Actinopolyspora TaxID=2639451 RepID=UPI0013F631D1|nr:MULTISPECIES: biotin-dependent carboxyltransferase family protein [unclassified Actinopolyspora]NHD17012.1 biotin-dependent carboxyltransferase [Actinopolyspora sp. BKK2]NHE76164.1 biotin-dependent carboxyltransferase [Actinopolyspora sp. BKK1]